MARTLPTDADIIFADVIVSNQLDFDKEGYQLRNITFPDPEYHPTVNSFTAKLQMYINRKAEERLVIYKHAMQGIRSGIPFPLIDKKYTALLQSTYQDFNIKDYNHETLSEYCADVCTYTRCIHLIGLTSPTSSAKSFIERALSMLRGEEKFSDQTYTEMDRWLRVEIEVESLVRPLSLQPVELSLDWINSPSTNSLDSPNQGASSSTRFYDDSFDEDNPGGTPRKPKCLRL